MRQVTIDSDSFSSLYEEILQRGGLFRFKVQGLSMYPALRNGDVLVVEAVSAGDLVLGDVVVFRRTEGQLVAHRVVAKALRDSRWHLSVRGDTARNAEDVPEDKVVGRGVAVKRGEKLIHVPRPSLRILGIPWYRVLLLLQGAAGIIRKCAKRPN